MKGEILADLELHAVDLSEESRRPQVVVCWIGLRFSKVGYPCLEMSDSL